MFFSFCSLDIPNTIIWNCRFVVCACFEMISVALFASFEWAIFPCFFLCLVIFFGCCWKLHIWKNRHFSQILQTVSLDITLKWKLMTSPVFSVSVCWVFPSACVAWPCFLLSQFPYINSSIFEGSIFQIVCTQLIVGLFVVYCMFIPVGQSSSSFQESRLLLLILFYD